LAVTVGAAATMAKAFGALMKVIYDFAASDLSPASVTPLCSPLKLFCVSSLV
jgi:hypothetical protein